MITPLTKHSRIGKELGINLFIKRDDLYPLSGGGSKARKLNYILNSDIQKKYNAVVTTGGSQSNHVRATALYAAMYGWKSICVIHDMEPKEFCGNLKIASLTGTELRFIKKENIEEAMDNAMDDLKKKGYNPLYIWGGGHCIEGSYALYVAVKELKEQMGSIKPDYVFVASGTGTTQAGIEIGIKQFYPECQVIGISIARKRNRGKEAVLNSIQELNSFLGNPVLSPNDIIFDDNWIGDGYENTYPELLETIHWAAKTEGLILDTTYTGKAFHALKKYAHNGSIPKKSNVVFWHTGGLLNLMASKKI